MKIRFKNLIPALLIMTMLSSAFVFPSSALRGGDAFDDVKSEQWFYDNVNYVSEKGIMLGVSNRTFAPDDSLSRAMGVTLLYRLAGEPDVSGSNTYFTDVPDDQWYTDAVKWAFGNKIVDGRENGIYDPDADITRAEFATMIMRYAGFEMLKLPYVPSDKADGRFTDKTNIPDYANNSVELLSGASIILGRTEDIFDPLAKITRAEAAAIICRFEENAEAQDMTLLEQNGLKIKGVSAYVNNMPELTPSDESAQHRFFSVKLESTDPQLIRPAITMYANVVDGNSHVDNVELTADGLNFGMSKIDADQIITAGHLLYATVTVNIGDNHHDYVFYPTVNIVI